jgi:hypothetical protein
MSERAFRGQKDKSLFDRALQRFGYSRLGGKLFITVFPAIDKRLMPLTRGRIKIGLRQPVCILHARGAKSGESRVTPLLCTPDGDRLVLVTSKAGAERDELWRLVNDNYAGYDVYQERAGARRIPVIVLEPR